MSRPQNGIDSLPELPSLRWTGSGVDRAALRRSEELLPTLLAIEATRVIEIWDAKVQLAEQLVCRSPQLQDLDRLGVFLGTVKGVDYVAIQLSEVADPEQWQGLRAGGLALSGADNQLLAQAVALLNWHQFHGCCARCGTATQVREAGYERECPQDGSRHYPRSDPAVIMTVVDNLDRVLLGRHPSWPAGQFSTLAGFVEPGESLEAAVRREVLEESGIRVGNMRYLGSQPWPFPSSLMMGFAAQAISTEIVVDGVEIEQARWFSRADLLGGISSGELRMSSTLSISRHLIEHWYGEALPENVQVPPARA